MVTQPLSLYLPMDRRQALARGAALPEQSYGVALLADIAGFTTLTETLARAVGPLRGAEEVAALLNQVYSRLIEAVDTFGGSVVCFSGDAITCWFDDADREPRRQGDKESCLLVSLSPASAANISPSSPLSQASLRATACALAMQRAMEAFAAISLPGGNRVALSLKVAVVGGRARRMRVGDPAIQYHEVLAGSLLDRLAALQHRVRSGQIVLDAATARAIGPQLLVTWRETADGELLAEVTGLAQAVAPQPWPALPASLAEEACQQWLLPAVAVRLADTPASFLAELRPAVALMLEFHGLDYDADERAGARLDSFIRWVQQVVARNGGALIDLTMGDRGSYLYAAWGAPEAHDDDAARAIAAARELLTPPPEMGWLADMRVGLARGTLWSGAYGGPTRRTYGVMGDATNLAFRLMSQAPAGAIWCDYAAMRAAERRWRFAPLPAVRVKGKAGAIGVYRPVALNEQPGAPRVGALVGRDAEQALLAGALDAVVAGECRVVVVEGEAGIGKSRLVHDLVQQVRARGLVGLLGAAQSIERNTPYRAWRDIIGSFFGLEGVADKVGQRSLVEATVQALRPDLRARAPLLNDVLHLDIPETPQTRALDPARRSESLDNLLAELLQAWARERPLMLVLEDAHWLCSRSWDMAVNVARALWAARQPLLLLLTTRPLAADDQGGVALGALMRLEGATRVYLGALPAPAIAALTTNRLGIGPEGLADELASLIQARSGGNPYFAEELVDTLQQRALIQLEGGGGGNPRYVASPVLAHDEHLLPDTLQGLLLARIDRLPPKEQLTLKVAAVVGTTFAYPPLRHARASTASTDDVALMRQLGTLVAQDFAALTTREPDLAYRFKHILAQEAAYRTLMYAQRRELHRTIAEWYERGEPASAGDAKPAPLQDGRSRLLPLLAHHYRQAEDVERERHYARLAGLQAADQYANREALAYFSRALELTPPDELAGRFDLHRACLDIHRRQEQMAVVAGELDLMEPLAEALEDNALRAFCAVQRAWHAWHTSDNPGAIMAARRATLLARIAGEPTVATEACRIVGLALWRRGDFSAAHAQIEMVLRLAREQGDKLSEAQAQNTLGCILMDMSDYVAGREAFQAAQQLSTEIGNQAYESMALRNLGGIALKMCDYDAARIYYLESLRVARAVGVTTAERTIPKDLGELALVTGDYDAAIAAYEESLRLIAMVGDQLLECEIYSELARLWWKRAACAPSREYAQRALAIAHSIGSGPLKADVLTTLGHIALDCGQYTQAQQSYQAVLDWRQEMGQATRLHEARAGLARVALAMGDLPGALLHVTAILPGLATGTVSSAAEPLLVALTCYQVLNAAADPRADDVLEAAFARLQRALVTIPDPLRQQMFLEQVPANRALVVAWSKHGLDMPTAVAVHPDSPVQKNSASSSQTASSGVTCGRPSGRAVESQNSSACANWRTA